jgi:hypothetical protein
MNVEIGTEAAHIQEKKYINGIFLAMHEICSEPVRKAHILPSFWQYINEIDLEPG